MKASNKIATFFKYFVLILVGVIMIYPLLWMISATFKDNSEIFAGISLWIKHPTLDGYRGALNNFGGSINILQAMLNTYSYVIPKVICTVVSACVAAYGFGRFDFPGRKLMFNIIRASFNQRRKTLANGLKNAATLDFTKEEVEAAIDALGKGASVRGETLTLEEFARLSDLLSPYKKG